MRNGLEMVKKNWRGGFSYLLTAQKLKRKINPPDN